MSNERFGIVGIDLGVTIISHAILRLNFSMDTYSHTE